jgi:hypothetical protein
MRQQCQTLQEREARCVACISWMWRFSPCSTRNLRNRNIFKVVRKVKNQYARAVRALQCTHLVVLLRTLQPLVGPFGILQVLLRSYSPLQGRLVHGHFNKAPFRCCMPRSNDASVTWLGLNSFIVQTFHSLQLDQQASKKR